MKTLTPAIELISVNKTYLSGKLEVPVLHCVDLEIKKGEMVAIMGPSGSGKSTLMHIIGLLDRPTGGEVYFDGQVIHLKMSDATLARLRSEKIGFVFQSFHLLPRLTALDNVLLPTAYRYRGRSDRLERAKMLLKRLGLNERTSHHPAELSGGENQRVAIARSLINDPDIILADEPTGNLDSVSGNEVIEVLKQLHKEGKTVAVITHDPAVAASCGRIIRIMDGKIQASGREKNAR